MKRLTDILWGNRPPPAGGEGPPANLQARQPRLARLLPTTLAITALLSLPLGAARAQQAGGPLLMRVSAMHTGGMVYVHALAGLAERVKQASGGRIEVQTLTGARAGSESDALKNIIQGHYQGGFISATVLANSLPAFRLLTLPLLFNDFSQVGAFIDSPLDRALRATAEAKRLRILGYGSYGFYGVLGFGAESISGSEGLVVRAPQDNWFLHAHQAAGLNAVIVPADDVPSAVENHWLSGIAATPEALARTPFPEQAQSFHHTRFIHGWTVLLVNRGWLARLPADLRQVVIEAGAEVGGMVLRGAQEREAQLLAGWGRRGAPEVVEPPPPSPALVQRLWPLIQAGAAEVERETQGAGQVLRLWEERLGTLASDHPAPPAVQAAPAAPPGPT